MPSLVRRSIDAWLVIATLLLTSAIPLRAQTPDGFAAKGYETIQAQQVYGYCKTLASPQFAGRLTGHTGYTGAARWVAAQFQRWGLKAVDASQGYLLPFATEFTTVEQAAMALLLPPAGMCVKLIA